MNKTVKTTCPYCGVGCGILAEVDAAQHKLRISGDPEHPANFGRLCSKGSALGDTVRLDGRLLQPQIHGQITSWDEALNTVADGFKRIIDLHGRDAVAIYASGQLLTEDYYVANKLMKGFIGSANIDTNSRLCMSSSVAGHKRAFGADTVPGCYADFEQAELLVLIGSNAAWCHPVSFQRIRAAKVANPKVKVVVIDPRATASCDIADLHLPLASGSDAWLFNGLLHYLQRHDALDPLFIEHHTEGFADALQAVKSATLSRVAEQCQLPEAAIEQFYRWFTETEQVMSLYSQGINQSSSGTDKVNAIINCHLATGRIGKPGMGPFSLTGQPNAMGGREVGGLAHQLAAHMDFSNPADIDRVARFWRSPNIAKQAGYPAVELFDAIYAGKVKAVWIMGTNPVVSLPNADQVKQALQACELVVVSDCMAHTDTTAFAHILLPATGWSEKDGTVTNSERRISRQRALFQPSGEAKPDWWIITQVAQRMGYGAAFAYQNPAQIFREHAALSAYENNPQHGVRDFDLSGLQTLDAEEYEALQPVQWPINAHYPQGRARLFGDGQFFTTSGKAQFVAVTPRPPVNAPDQDFPLILNTARLRDQWHTMTRTALSARLNQHRPEPLLDVHPKDAKRYRLQDGGLAQLQSLYGQMLARVSVNDSVQPGQLCVPMHWNAQFASLGRMGALVNPVIDPISKQPESKHTPVKVQPFNAAWYGFVLSRNSGDFSATEYWLRSPGDGFQRYELAGLSPVEDKQRWLVQCLGLESLSGDWLEYHDTATGSYRAALIIDAQLHSVFCAAPTPQLPERSWLASLFQQTTLDAATRRSLLSGKPPAGGESCGPVVCACFNVGLFTIQNAIQQQGLKTVQDVGRCLKAGSNCGSCIPELQSLLAVK